MFLPAYQSFPLLLAGALGNHPSYIGYRVNGTVLQSVPPFWSWNGHVTQPRSMVSVAFESWWTEGVKRRELIPPKGGALKRLLIGFCCSLSLLPITPEICLFSIYFHSLSCPHVFPIIFIGLGWPGLDSVACKNRTLEKISSRLKQIFAFRNTCPSKTVTYVAQKKIGSGYTLPQSLVWKCFSGLLLCCSV